MKLYVINLETSQERLQRMHAIFAARGLSFTRIDAVDARCLPQALHSKINEMNLWSQEMTYGEVACFLSHKRALEQLIADGAPYGIIFEDDILLGVGATKILSSADWVPDEAEIVKLETSGKKVQLGPPQHVAIKGFSLAYIKNTHIMAAAYLISRQAALRLVSLMEEASAPFDHFLFNFSLGIAPHFILFQIDPAPVIQTVLPSTLEGERAIIKQAKKHNRTISQTCKREVSRIFERAGVGLWGMKVNYFSDDQWKRVPFSGLGNDNQ